MDETDETGVVLVEEKEYLEATNVEQSEAKEQFCVGVGRAGAGGRTAFVNGDTFDLRLAIPDIFSEQGVGKVFASAFSLGVDEGMETLDEKTFA